MFTSARFLVTLLINIQDELWQLAEARSRYCFDQASPNPFNRCHSASQCLIIRINANLHPRYTLNSLQQNLLRNDDNLGWK